MWRPGKKKLANAPGVGEWGRKNWAVDFPIIIDTGFGGGGLQSYPRLQRYVEYMGSFHPKANLVKTREKESEFAFANHQGWKSDDSTVLPFGLMGPLDRRALD